MKIAIIGAGAMGSIFGAMLSKVSDVVLINPDNKHVFAITEKGLLIENADSILSSYRLKVYTDYKKVEDRFNLAIIFTKAYSTKKASLAAKYILTKEGIALTMQNGIGNFEVIADIVSKNRVVAGTTSHGATLVKPGHVRHAGTGPTYIADNLIYKEMVEKIAKIFNMAGIKTSISKNMESLIWGKLVINVGINALTAILKVPNGILGITKECEKIMKRAVLEAVEVASALEIKLPFDNPFEQVKKVCANTANNRASMLQDTMRGSRTEIGVINRAIVEKGEKLGILTPYNEFLSEVIEALESTYDYQF